MTTPATTIRLTPLDDARARALGERGGAHPDRARAAGIRRALELAEQSEGLAARVAALLAERADPHR